MKNKTIVINLLNFISPQLAGTGIFARNLLSTWLKKSGANFTVIILHADHINPTVLFDLPDSPDLHFQGVRVRSLWVRILYEQFVLPFRLFDKQLYFSPTPSLPFLARLFNRSLRTIVTIHDMIPFRFPEKYPPLRRVYVKWLSRNAARAADQVLTVSENSKKDILLYAGVKAPKVTVMYNFLSQPFLSDNVDDGRFFLCISTIEPGKNVENTLKGFELFLQQNQPFRHFRLVWIGQLGWGYTASDIEKWMTGDILRKQVSFTGYIGEEDKRRLLKTCTAVLCLSHYEGFGLPVLEGLYHNKPSLVSTGSSLTEISGETGLACDPLDMEDIAEKLARLIGELPVLKSKIPGHLKRFDPERQVSTFERVINMNSSF